MVNDVNPRRVFLVDDHTLLREWLAELICRECEFSICGTSRSRKECVEAMARSNPDVVIIDFSVRRGSAFDLITRIKRRLPRIKVIAIILRDTPGYGRRAMLAGASACILRPELAHKIHETIRAVLQRPPAGQRSGRSAGRAVAQAPDALDTSVLSDREFEIFYSLGAGQSTRQIADALSLSIKTVQAHCSNIRDKLGLHGFGELLVAAVRWNERQD